MKNTSLRRQIVLLSAITGVALSSSSLRAAELFWDSDGATAGGSATTTATGIWGTSTFWSTDPNGAAATAAWTSGSVAVFSAGTDVTGTSGITFNGTQTVAGLRIEEGVVSMTGAGAVAVGTGTIQINTGAVLSIDSTSRLTSSAGAVITLDGGTLRNTIAGAGSTFVASTFNIAVTANGGTVDASNATAGQNVAFAGRILGPGVLTKAGPGDFRTQNASTNNSFSKLVVIGGTFRPGNLVLVTDENTLSTNGIFGAIPGSFQADNITLNGGAIGDVNNLTLHNNRGITLGSNGGTLSTDSGSVIVPGAITGTGTLYVGNSVGTSGVAVVTLKSTSSDYSGNTTVTAGTLRLGAAGVIPDGSNLAVLGGAFDLGGFNETVANVIVNASTSKILTNAGTPILTATSYDVRQSDTASGGGISAKIGGAASLTKTTANSALLSAVNTYTGSTTVTAGTLSIDADATLGDGTGNLNLNGGTLNATASRTVSTDPVANPINVTASSVIATTSAATTVNLNLSSNTVGGSAGQLTFTNSGADAATDIFQPRFSGNGFDMPRPIVIDNGPTGKTNLSSFNQTGTQTFSGVISGNGSYTRNSGTAGAGGATVFTQPNLYSGGTSISDGTLYANNASGSATGTGSITIAVNGTLAGTGGVSGATTSAGTIAPGLGSNGIGTLKTGDVTLSTAGSKLAVDIDVSNTPAADLLDVTGAVSLTGSTLSLALANAPAPDESFVPQTYIVVNNDAADAVTGTFDTIIVSVPGYKAVIDTAYTGTDILGRIGDGNDIAVTVSVPEPAALSGLLLGGLGLLSRRRRSAGKIAN